jgi:hypothetical protein
MKSLIVKIDNATLARLQRSAERDGITIDAAILDGIRAYIQGEEEAPERAPLRNVFPNPSTGLN